jgi:cell division protein FtsI/penicillin-binding protein 2
LFVVAALSQAKVQLLDRSTILERAEKSKRFTVQRDLYARRGKILSADMKPLAQDEDSFELGLNFENAPRSRAFYMDLAAATGRAASEFDQLAGQGVAGRVWRTPMGSLQEKAVQRVKQKWRVDGLSVDRTGRRAYGLGEAGAGLVGFVRDGVPQSGLELSQNDLLKGKNGFMRGLVDRTGAFLPMRQNAGSVEAQDGKSIVLTIDSDLQVAAATAIKAVVEAYKADTGSAIVMDPYTGEILAMANWPTFDPNTGMRETSSKYSLDLNPGFQCVLEPGSTFKPLTLAKALDQGVVNPLEKIYCSGSLTLGKYKPIRCDAHHGSRAHGSLDAEKAIVKSCNVSAAIWATRIGYQSMVKYIEELGLLSPTSIGVPNELKGQFNYNEYAKPLQLATLGFGQSITVTPIGLASAFCMLANEGVLVPPRLIKKIDDREVPAGTPKRIVSAKAANTVLGFMESVVQTKEGTGATLRIPGYRLAGKTGTAEKVNNTPGEKGYVSNFVGFVPMPRPRALILVMVDNPKGGRYYGATVAGPAFVELAKAVIRRYGIAPSGEVSLGRAAKTPKPAVTPKK